MLRIASLVLLIVGVILLIWGVRASDSYDAGFARMFSGTPSAKAVFLLITGLAATVIGLAGALRNRGS